MEDKKRTVGLLDEVSHEMIISDTLDASEHLIAKELEERVAQLVEMLPPQCREIFRLSHIEELSHAEIAMTLNVSLGTVKTQIFRALAKIRAGLTDYLPGIISAIYLHWE